MDEFKRCLECGGRLAANGKCPDCGAPAEEPPWLDDYGYQEAGEPAPTRGEPSKDTAGGKAPQGAGRVLPFPAARPQPMTAAELYARADERPGLTLEQAEELDRMFAQMAKDRGEQPPRSVVEILKHAKGGGAPDPPAENG